MPRFNLKRRTTPKLAQGVFTIRRGIGFLQAGDFVSALKEFRKVAGSKKGDTTHLVKGVAAFYIYNTERLRKESKKALFGNGHLIEFTDVNSRNAWSDIDIAAVLVTPNNPFTNRFLASFLGRSEEAIRFQRRYTFSRPLSSWVAESGNKYTRFTQTREVARKLGVAG
jgi:hypothetical protein